MTYNENTLDKLDGKSLLGILHSDLQTCVDGDNEQWGVDEYKSLLDIVKELQVREKLRND